MKQSKVPTPTREEVFRQKAATYTVCYSTACPNRDHCLRSLLSPYVPQDKMVCTSMAMEASGCKPVVLPQDEMDRMVERFKGYGKVHEEHEQI